MRLLIRYVDDIFLLAGFVLLVVAGVYVSPAVALYTAAVECLSAAYLVSYAVRGKKE